MTNVQKAPERANGEPCAEAARPPSLHEIHERGIREAAEIRDLEPARTDCLGGAKLPEVLLHGLHDASVTSPARGMLHAVRLDLAGFARLALVAAENSAADLLSVSEHIGQPLEQLVRRLDVVIEMLDREASGRLARKARRARRAAY